MVEHGPRALPPTAHPLKASTMRSLCCALLLWHGLSLHAFIVADDPWIEIDASKVVHPISPLLTGACIEDVNHEIYGGLYSQMVFGESFQEPAASRPIRGCTLYDGDWVARSGIVRVSEGKGNKLLLDRPELRDGAVSVDVLFEDAAAGNAGVILRVTHPRRGADHFFGYEVSLEPARQVLVLGRHRNNWEHLQDYPCQVHIGAWNRLHVELAGARLTISVNDRERFVFTDPDPRQLEIGKVGVRQWERKASFRNLSVRQGNHLESPSWNQVPTELKQEVSGMWTRMIQGSARGEFSLSSESPFIGSQSQEIRFVDGQGIVGVSNQGLNRWGMAFKEGHDYEGVLFARADAPIDLWVAVEDADGAHVLSEQKCSLNASGWQRLRFSLRPYVSADRGRFRIGLKSPGSVTIGYASLHPGAWGRFCDLPVRRDVAEALQQQGITFLRYGGSMINNEEYRWKKMIGPREERPPYRGFWYPYSTNGWGIVDFMNFCEAAGFEYVPTFSMSETPEDLADFVRYAKDPVESAWGKRRAEDGHPDPYRIKILQLGNEERVDRAYAERFESRADAIWSVDPTMQLVVGDFVYDHPIVDPMKISGAASGITSLEGQKRLLQFAKSRDQEIWFDVHVWTGGPRPNASFDSMFTFIDALESLADGAKFKVLTFEFNANNHDQQRAIANALAIHAIQRDGRLPIATSANCLQPDGQNDNGWNQGLLFLSPSRTWLQPPGYVTQMFSTNDQPTLVSCEVVQDGNALDCNATLSEDGTSLVISMVHLSDQSTTVTLKVDGMKLLQDSARVQELAGPLQATNTEAEPFTVQPVYREWKHALSRGSDTIELRPNSITKILLQ